jgi:hypothetical protein
MKRFNCICLLTLLVFSCQERKANGGGGINGHKLDGSIYANENGSPVSGNAGSEVNPSDIVSAVTLAEDSELENSDSSEFDFFLGKWLMLDTDYIDRNLAINDEEHNSYIEIYKKDGKYHANIKRFTGYLWVYDTGILSKEPAWELPFYFDFEVYINCDGGIYRLYIQENFDDRDPLYRNVIYLGDDIQSFAYQRKEIISFLERKVGVLNDDRVRIRAEPNLSGEIRGTLSRGDKVAILEIGRERQKIDGLESVWYKVRTDANIEGWVFGAYVDPL